MPDSTVQYIKLAKPDPSSHFIVRPDPTRPDPRLELKSSTRPELDLEKLDPTRARRK